MRIEEVHPEKESRPGLAHDLARGARRLRALSGSGMLRRLDHVVFREPLPQLKLGSQHHAARHDRGAAITGMRKCFRDGHSRGVEHHSILHEAVRARAQSGENRGVRRCGERNHARRLAPLSSAPRDPVQLRGAHHGISGTAQMIRAKRVQRDQHERGFCRRGGAPARGGGEANGRGGESGRAAQRH